VGADKRLAERVILEIVRRSAGSERIGPWLTREALAHVFWFAHLYYAKRQPGYLTNWPLVRTPWGVEIRDASGLLRRLVEEGFVRPEQVERGPFSLTVYSPTGQEPGSELPDAAVQAIQQALDEGPLSPQCWCHGPAVTSRAWRATAVGEEMDIYLDLIPEDQYEERRHQLEGLKDSLGDLFA
jgi:hypothetical protein